MKTFFLKSFKKNYKNRIKSFKNLDSRFVQRYKLFILNSQNPVLNDHALTGDLKGFRAFSITGDIRVVYFLKDNTAFFVDIGTHNQVY